MKKNIKIALLSLVAIVAIAFILEVTVFRNSFKQPVKTELKERE